jgi:phosphoribosylformylglycinamidine synthase
MAIGGDVGAEVDLSQISPSLRSDFKLFSESNTRWIIEVEDRKHRDFEDLMKKHSSPFIKIGSTKGKSIIINDENMVVVNLSINDIRAQWQEPIWSLMG